MCIRDRTVLWSTSDRGTVLWSTLDRGTVPWSVEELAVDNSPSPVGVIHSSLNCSTCFSTTTYAFLPELSGLTEADAVADQGERSSAPSASRAPPSSGRTVSARPRWPSVPHARPPRTSARRRSSPRPCTPTMPTVPTARTAASATASAPSLRPSRSSPTVRSGSGTTPRTSPRTVTPWRRCSPSAPAPPSRPSWRQPASVRPSVADIHINFSAH